jgi:ubiquinone/menaquinone biosynthesis C-methylase UbiE
MTGEKHNDIIIDQFTKQAAGFFNSSIHGGHTLDLLIKASGAGVNDTVLDVACGPGLVGVAFASHVKHVTGIDVTPAMIKQAKDYQRQKGLANLDWQVGDVTRLPFADGTFTSVTCRYGFHHLKDPKSVFAEMVRVCAPGGRVVLTDVTAPVDPEKAKAFDQAEIWRDPSHVRILALAEMEELFAGKSLRDIKKYFYELEIGIEDQLSKSAATTDDAERFRRVFREKPQSLGIRVWNIEGKDFMAYPIAVLVGQKP